jgi:hypothetical protein
VELADHEHAAPVLTCTTIDPAKDDAGEGGVTLKVQVPGWLSVIG